MSDDSGRSQVFSITLTELVLLLFFLLLFTAVWQISRIKTAAARDASKLTGLEAMVTASLGSGDPDSLRAIVESAAENAAAEQKAEELGEQIEAMESLIAQAAGQESEEFVKLIRTAAQVERGQHERDELRESVDSLHGVAQTLEERNANLAGQVKHYQRQVQNRGLGFPPCWADAEGKPEYIFNVHLKEGALVTTPAWPPHRAGAVEAVTGASALAHTDLSPAEFARRALPVRRWSQSEDPECRHFVRITDDATMSKIAFKSHLLLVEDFFYKYLSGSR